MLQTLLLRNFRNYKEETLTFSPKKNLIFGENAQGKTNLIEAISLVTTGRSHRTSHLTECIAFDESFFYLEALFIKDGVEQTVKLYYSRAKRSLTIDGKTRSSFSPLIGINPSVLHTPNDLLLITSTPSLRRKLFDLHISSHDRDYLFALIRYYKAKKQRDHLLKTKIVDAIDCFEEQMSDYAKVIKTKREAMIDQLQPYFSSFAQKLLCNQNLKISFLPSASDTLLQLLQSNRQKEMILGSTLQGPHRDDFAFSIEDKLAKAFASEGQKRACILALRLAEYQRLKTYSKNLLFCIDDMATHFDPKRQERLKEVLEDLDQVILTLPDPDTKLAIADKKFLVTSGRVEACS